MAVAGRLRPETAHAPDATVDIDVPVAVAVDVGEPRKHTAGHHVRVLQPPDQTAEQTQADVASRIEDACRPGRQRVQGDRRVHGPDVDDFLRQRPGRRRVGGRRPGPEGPRGPAGRVAGTAVRQRYTHIEIVRRPGDRAERAHRQSHLQGRVHFRVQRHILVAVQPGHARRPAGRLLFRQEGHLARQRGQGSAQEVRFANEHHFPRKRIRQQFRKGKLPPHPPPPTT